MRQLLVLLLSICAGVVYSQQFRFIEYSVQDGLAQSQVTSITQDQKGYLWIGTQGGLSRFDGVNFKNYSTKDGLAGNSITKLCFDQNENLWIAANGGVSKMSAEGQIDRYLFNNEYTGTTVSDITFFENEVYISSNGKGLFKLKEGKIIAINHTSLDLKIRALIVRNDTLLLGTKHGVRFMTANNEFASYNSTLDSISISSFAIHGDSLIVGTYGKGVFIVSPKNQFFRSHEDNRLNRPRKVFVSEDGAIWLSTRNGVVEYKQQGVQLFTEKEGLPTSNIHWIYSDFENNMWFGTSGNGVQKFTSFSFLSFTSSLGMSSNKVMSISKDTKGNMWFGTIDKGVIRFDGKEFLNFSGTGELRSNTVRSFFKDGERLLLCTYAGIVVQEYVDNKIQFSLDKRFDSLKNERVMCISRDKSDTYWIGTSRGIWRSNTDGTVFLEPEDKGYSGMIRTIQMDHHDKIYAATTTGLYVLENDKFKEVVLKGNENNEVNCLTFTAQNNAFLGTSNGLYMQTSNGFSRTDLGKEFNENIVNFLSLDDQENLYIGTNNGLFLIKKSSGVYATENPMKFSIAHGLNSVETNLGSNYFDEGNNLWFGTVGGVIKQIKNDEVLYSEDKPKLQLLDFQLFFNEVDWRSKEFQLDENGLPNGIELKSKQNHITFKFIGLFFKDPQNVVYQYRLLGISEVWSPESKLTSITYPELNSGDYTFEVRSKYGDGEWSESKSFNFIIESPYYKTLWFFLVVSLAILLLIYGLFQYRLNTVRRNKETEKLVLQGKLLSLEQRSLNASMNRHFIFNSLNSIQYFINMKDRISANKYLTNFAKLIRKNLDSSTAEDNLVTLEDELERLKLYLSLEMMRFQNKFDYEFNISPKLDIEHVKIPAMMLQPFIENSIIHGVLPKKDNKGKIILNIEEEGADFIVIEILDNGIGIETSRKQKQTIEGDHISQGMRITQSRIEIIKNLTNKKLLLVGPKQINNNDGSIYGTHVLIKIPT